MEDVTFSPIGVVHSPFKAPTGTPIQPRAGHGIEGTVELLPEYTPGLKDLEGFSHVILLCHLHLSRAARMEVVPYLDDQVRGLFATRSPSRPNAIGLSVVRLLAVDGNVLRVRDLDLVDGTPVLDIKPYVPAFDDGEEVEFGWLEGKLDRLRAMRDDGRFEEG